MDDDSLLASMVTGEAPAFDSPAMVNTMQRAIDIAFLPDVRRIQWTSFLAEARVKHNQRGLQGCVTIFLTQSTLGFIASEFLTKRMMRWNPSVSEAGREWWSFCGSFVVQLLVCELRGAPQCVIAACLKTMLNGWASARRF